MRYIAAVVLQPLFLFMLALGLGLTWRWWRRSSTRRGLFMNLAAFAGLWLSCCAVIAYLALGTLEWRYLPERAPGEPIEAIVVLSGSSQVPSFDPKASNLGADTYYRCLHALDLYEQHGPALIVVSGGADLAWPARPPLAEVMRDFLVRGGVPAEKVIVEPKAQDTHENATESCKLLRERGIKHLVLVTDACHMPRAMACFRHEGMEVLAAPCNFRTAGFRNSWQSYVPTPLGASQLESAVHEWIGLAYYWLRGWIA